MKASQLIKETPGLAVERCGHMHFMSLPVDHGEPVKASGPGAEKTLECVKRKHAIAVLKVRGQYGDR